IEQPRPTLGDRERCDRIRLCLGHFRAVLADAERFHDPSRAVGRAGPASAVSRYHRLSRRALAASWSAERHVPGRDKTSVPHLPFPTGLVALPPPAPCPP